MEPCFNSLCDIIGKILIFILTQSHIFIKRANSSPGKYKLLSFLCCLMTLDLTSDFQIGDGISEVFLFAVRTEVLF